MTPIVVTTAGDARLADYVHLNDQAFRRTLERDEFFIAEGYVAIERMMDSGHELRSVLLAPSRVERFEPHLPRLAAAGVPVYVAEREVMASVVGFDLHRGVLASGVRRVAPALDDLARSSRRLVVLEALNDGENIGAIARAARAFGFDALLIGPTCADPYARRTVRVSMGEVLHLPTVRGGADWPADIATLHDAGFETWAMTPADDATDLWATPVPDRLAVVLGAEGPGLAALTMRATTRRVRIPISPDVDSLNVGHAAAVTFAAISRPSTPPR